MPDREKLIELVKHARMDADLCCGQHLCSNCPNGKYCTDGFAADFLIAHGVTFATDTNVGVKTNIYDSEEIHHNCTVQILHNSVTGEQSIGWWHENEPPVEG